MNSYVIKVDRVSKNFNIPHEKRNTFKEHFWNVFKPRKKESFEALSNVCFEVRKGEWLGLIGRNGSGKSTLLKMLAGIYQPDSGKIVTKGKIIPFLELGVGFNSELSARENIFLNGTMLGMTREGLENSFDKIVEFAEIKSFLDTPLKNFSSGMQVRLAFAIAIQSEGDIYLLDEVMAVGDTVFQQRCLEEFLELKENGKTVILVSHDADLVRRTCKRAVLLENRKVKRIGKSDDICDLYTQYNIEIKEKIKARDKKRDRGKEERDGTKDASVSSVYFADRNGESRNVFRRGDEINVNIEYDVKDGVTLEKPVFGIGIHNQSGVHVFGCYTDDLGVRIHKIKEKGKIAFKINDVNLSAGSYLISIAIYSESRVIPIDRVVKAYTFEIAQGRAKDFGVVQLSSEWKIQ
ncbi:ABC transporter ATP-binding protein [Patescibacteria group bacterium]|nr:ABC transporter ATP-binding protein [Patescibacteria group bacterium]